MYTHACVNICALVCVRMVMGAFDSEFMHMYTRTFT